MLEERLRHLRATDPKQFALFTGRDQMQALTGLFARQFGTPNYAAHGGFCSVNMAAGMIYTIGGSFWEFGGPDLDRAKLFVMIGTAEDHHSNPMKVALSPSSSAPAAASSPSTRCAPAMRPSPTSGSPIKPGTDGALLLALMHELIALGLYDRDFLARYTNAGQLVNQDAASDDFGLMLRNAEGDVVNPLRPHNFYWWDRHTGQPVADHAEGADPALLGASRCPTAHRRCRPSSC
jgi:anaerobic selenocysteine-containing dehydrogenase